MVGMTVVMEVLIVLTDVVGQAGATVTRVEPAELTGGGMTEPVLVGADSDSVSAGPEGEPVSVAVTGHTVVDTATVSVTTVVEWAGQLVTVSGQLVTVRVVVLKMVEVVRGTTEEVTTVELAGQLVTSGAHDVMVKYSVEKTVLWASSSELWLWAMAAPARATVARAKRILATVRGFRGKRRGCCEWLVKD